MPGFPLQPQKKPSAERKEKKRKEKERKGKERLGKARKGKERKGNTTPFGVNFIRSPVLYPGLS